MQVKYFIIFSLFVFSLMTNSSTVAALPWDIDLYRQQSLKSNEIARSPVKGTVPVGFIPFNMTIEEAEKNLTNPVPFEENSVWRGQRLWGNQCSACHGVKGDSGHFVGKAVAAPNLLEERFKAYTDGRVYATIYYGIRSMPRYGYKLSEGERWDIVNYLKFLQGKQTVSTVKKPE